MNWGEKNVNGVGDEMQPIATAQGIAAVSL
jgi:hypothetical protein